MPVQKGYYTKRIRVKGGGVIYDTLKRFNDKVVHYVTKKVGGSLRLVPIDAVDLMTATTQNTRNQPQDLSSSVPNLYANAPDVKASRNEILRSINMALGGIKPVRSGGMLKRII